MKNLIKDQWEINPNNPRNIRVNDRIDIEVWGKDVDANEVEQVVRLIQMVPNMAAILEWLKEIEETTGTTYVKQERAYRRTAYRAQDILLELQKGSFQAEASE